MNAKDLINKRGKSVTLSREATAPVTDEEGRTTASARTDTTIVMFVYPASGQDLKVLAGGDMTKTYLSGLCYDEVRTIDRANGLSADRIVTDGKTYEILNVKFYEAVGVSLQPFYQVLMAEVNS